MRPTWILVSLLLLSSSSFGQNVFDMSEKPTTRPATKPASQPAKPLVFDDIIHSIADVIPPANKPWLPLKVSAANDVLTPMVGRECLMVFPAADSGVLEPDLPMADQQLRGPFWVSNAPELIGTWRWYVKVYVDDAEKAQVARVNAGDTIRARGALAKLKVEKVSNYWRLTIVLGHATIESVTPPKAKPRK